MEGSLSDLDFYSLLQSLSLTQRTGELYIEDEGGQYWLLLLTNGRILYIADIHSQSLHRLQDYLHGNNLRTPDQSELSDSTAGSSWPEYEALWWLLQQDQIDMTQAHHLLRSMIRESLLDVASLYRGWFCWQTATLGIPQLTTYPLIGLLSDVMEQLREWKTLYPYIRSPDQYLHPGDSPQPQALLAESSWKLLQAWMQDQLSLRVLSRRLGRDISSVGKVILPYLHQGLVQLTPPPAPPRPVALHIQRHTPRIMCVDDSLTIRQFVEKTLSQAGYEATGIAHPLKALSLIFQLHPDLIFCDLNMPELNGYDFCAMLRHTPQFRHTPIIILTSHSGLSERLRANILGANNYLAKPFSPDELLSLVEYYAGRPNPSLNDPEKILQDVL
ncbi:response regulator [Synechococcus sp. PCC 6312]|uniref:response regulator n=1 Tax=Synechococcus sp. (strain ATCC 27167 / PCC 6312) TaxID=195253 RepID=UPI00029ED8DC|nr:response regulator [Synechococcus sp. PCC 6312]AFY62561.1 response regulator with CheY-like receiver domain and winged-helix DNA-binding domain [Synechococcus sp. PCC 6312]